MLDLLICPMPSTITNPSSHDFHINFRVKEENKFKQECVIKSSVNKVFRYIIPFYFILMLDNKYKNNLQFKYSN